MRKKFFYASKQRMIFIASIFMKLVITKVFYLDIRVTNDFHIVWKTYKMRTKFNLHLWLTLGFHCMDFHATHDCQYVLKKFTAGHFCHVRDAS